MLMDTIWHKRHTVKDQAQHFSSTREESFNHLLKNKGQNMTGLLENWKDGGETHSCSSNLATTISKHHHELLS